MQLFNEGSLGSLILKNRVVMAPMCMYSADTDGIAQPFHTTHYTARAYGGVGLIIQEATAVEPRGRISENDLGIWDDRHIEGLKDIVDRVHLAGSKVAIQLAHAGRKCTVKTETIISSTDEAFSDRYAKPVQMNEQDITEVLEAFRQGARRARLAGYDGIEIHGAHGYLINQFISPLTNKLGGNFGGNLEKRGNFVIKVIEAIRQEWQGPLWLRLSADEFAEDGHHIEETLELLSLLKGKIDGVNVSSGGVVPVVPKVFPGYQLSYAEKIRQGGFTVIGGGLITTEEQIEEALTSGKVDFVYLARELLLNPYFVLRVAKKHAPEYMLKAYERG